MSSRSLPSNFKQNSYRKRAISGNNNNASTISRATISEGHTSQLYSSSFNSSNAKVSSPLTQQPWINSTVPTDSSGTMSDKSWMTRRWSTLSGSLIARRQKIRKKTNKSWKNRQKRRTFPPSQDVLKKDKKNFSTFKRKTSVDRNPKSNRQSLQEILTQFDQQPITIDNSPSSATSSSSLSKRLGRLLKKKGKQPYRKKKRPPSLFITSDEFLVPNNPFVFFQPPATVSSQSSTPNTPVKFPTPPKRFSAYYVDLEGNLGKTNYKKPGYIKEQIILAIDTLRKHFSKEKRSPEKRYTSYYQRQLFISLCLFLMGFLVFPCWWVGTYLYFVKKKDLIMLKKRQQEEKQPYYFMNEFDLISIHTFGCLNSIFSCLSFVLIALIIALIILYSRKN